MAFNLDFLRNKVYQVNGLTITVGGLIVAAIVLYIVLRKK